MSRASAPSAGTHRWRRLRRVCGALLALCCGLAGPCLAHEMRPALLQLREINALAYEVLWKRPLNAGRALPLEVRFPPHCAAQPRPPDQVTGSAWIQRSLLQCRGEGLGRHSVAIAGLDATLTDTLVRVSWLDGSHLDRVLRPGAPELAFDAPDVPALLDYLHLGVVHLLTGYDHLLFVLGLLYLGQSGWALVRIVTAFTLAHSITLALSVLGLVRLSQGPTEAAIALSILYLAVELTRGQDTALHRRPWLLVLAFGLLHGFGFAGALREIGLPEDTLAAALLLFNLGLELGQLMVVAAGLALAVALRRLAVPVPAWVQVSPLWAIGSLSGYWLIDRALKVLGA